MQGYSPLERLRRRTGVASLALLVLLARAWIPVGFMPAALGEGGPVAICHGGAAGEIFRSLAARGGESGTAAHGVLPGGHGIRHAVDTAADAGHAAHGAPEGSSGHDAGVPAGTSASDHEAWEHCPFGAAFGAALVAADFEPGLLTLAHALEAGASAQPVPASLVASYRARAPPIPAIHV